MRCLVVGGTGFLGGAMADVLAGAGHAVTILARGRTQRAMRPPGDIIRADRYGALPDLSNHEFDWVFDTCAYAPGAVKSLLTALGDRIGRYVLVSSVSAYGSFAKSGLNETDPAPSATRADLDLAAKLPAESRASAVAYGASYGPLKRACEITADQMLGDRATALRVGLLVGAGDYSDRLTWWVRRIDMARGHRRDIPAPAPAERPVQLIDVRDVAAFAVHAAVLGLGGIWNVTGTPMPLGGLLAAIRGVAGSEARLVWVSADKITGAGIAPWVDIPLMAPPIPEFRHFLEVSTEKARAAGLICRPVEDTLNPLLDWDRGRRARALTCGMSPRQEAQLLV